MPAPASASISLQEQHKTAPVAVICGNGRIPLQVLDGLETQERATYVVAIKGEAEADLQARADIELGWGEIGRLYKSMAKAGCKQVLLIGGVAKRPDFTSIVGDLGTLKRLPKIIKALVGGDDSLLTKVIGLFEVEGYQVVGIKDITPELLAAGDAMGLQKPRAEDFRDLELARLATTRLGDLDIGQAAVALGGRVIAVEGAEGTDAMLERCASLRESGRVRAKGKAGVLVKAVKPRQDLRVDLPTIGPKTVELASKAGLAGIAVEAGGALVSDRAETIAEADAAGLFLFGFQTDPPDDGS
ncbi:UDP-2,3-diacylglucosamine diphosphatase LpxI [Labrenzia sp. CE80]|uniref:LpxI family protein n=1 Tax=Labrenzia sp. CE80 TaxID=1788986 RepID=UPI00129BB40B|nr:UDP-2,3-diacylglucosamine diphosphatase LpxI [Labrenzia sp. CE80]